MDGVGFSFLILTRSYIINLIMKKKVAKFYFTEGILFVFLLSLFTLPNFVSGAVLYIDPEEGTISSEQMFSVNVRIDNQDECLNVFDVKLYYPSDMIEATSVSRGRSILSLWTQEPVIDNKKGEISFTGGVPGGYCGRVSGDPELTNVLVTVIFQPLIGEDFSGETEIRFDDKSAVLLSDGQGTFAETRFIDAIYEVGEEATVHAEEWLELLREDGRPPVSFDVILMQDESVYDGKYYIAFSTTDKGSGLSHYEVKEEDIDREGFLRGSKKEANFERAKSPYLLRDQTLNSKITVRAVDNAGNHSVAYLIPDDDLRQSDEGPFFAMISKVVFQHPVSFALTMALIAFLLFSLFYLRKTIMGSLRRKPIKTDEEYDPKR